MKRKGALSLLPLILLLPHAPAQTAKPFHTSDFLSMGGDIPGSHAAVPLVSIAPVAHVPFFASVETVSHERMPDGSDYIRSTSTRIARAASGRIYNERRLLVSKSYNGTPPLLSARIFDPVSGTSVLLEPYSHVARKRILRRGHRPLIPRGIPRPNPNPGPGRTEESLGTKVIDGLTVYGIRKTRTIARANGQPLTVVDEFWYSPDLLIDVLIKHTDSRGGEQDVTVQNIWRSEPEASIFAVPADYKVVAE